MSPDLIIISTLLLVLPISLKYFFALETRTLVARARRGDRQLGSLVCRLQALDRERAVVHAALLQVRHQQQWAGQRHRMIENELRQLRARSEGRRAPEPASDGAQTQRAAQDLTAAAEAYAA